MIDSRGLDDWLDIMVKRKVKMTPRILFQQRDGDARHCDKECWRRRSLWWVWCACEINKKWSCPIGSIQHSRVSGNHLSRDWIEILEVWGMKSSLEARRKRLRTSVLWQVGGGRGEKGKILAFDKILFSTST